MDELTYLGQARTHAIWYTPCSAAPPHNFLLGDGSVRFIKETVNPTVFSALATRAGSEVVGADQH